jgi:putative redox protein
MSVANTSALFTDVTEQIDTMVAPALLCSDDSNYLSDFVPEVEELMPKVNVSLIEGTRATITARAHSWVADEPIKDGGTDKGPSPYELLLGSLGACTAITLSLYAKYKGIDIESVEIEYEFNRVHAEDCKECESDEKGLLDVIRSKATIWGKFDEASRRRLEQIVSRCPVHKTLERKINVFDSVEFIE